MVARMRFFHIFGGATRSSTYLVQHASEKTKSILASSHAVGHPQVHHVATTRSESDLLATLEKKQKVGLTSVLVIIAQPLAVFAR